MPAARYFSPVNTLEQKLQIQRRLGGVKSCTYFHLIRRYLNLKISKIEFDRVCIQTIGRENIPLHNHFIKSILKKACLPLQKQSRVQAPLNVKTPNGCNGLPPLCKDFPQSPRKCRTPNSRDRSRFSERLSPLGPHGKNSSIGVENSALKIQEQQHDSTPKVQEQQHDLTPKTQEQPCDSTPKIQEQLRHTDPHCAVNRLPVSVENGEEVDRDSESLPIIRSPIRAPLAQDREQRHTDPHCAVNRLPVSMEYEEEVDRDSESLAISRMSPIQAPLGLPTYDNRAQRLTHKRLLSGIVSDTCQSIGHLPDTGSLMKRLEHNMETEGFKVSADAVNVLNNALNVYLKRLIKPCLDLATSKSVKKVSSQIQPGLNELPRNRCMQKIIGPASASISDFKTAMELNPTILGVDWSLHYERVCFLASEE
ncbi:uncharacterized protein LOC123919762 [Trifolium pratense]|uniref:uncharacterized protein LOC123919762 n=1 Tax=Trifolium pratense TaxID=57577 RepID=UPI001E69197E|nr:uncharacterized protein LOC123919762 [Trifolium pratense]XP_045827716.1 uncharacterized protein LOC123919762 [Trifolium pratense]